MHIIDDSINLVKGGDAGSASAGKTWWPYVPLPSNRKQAMGTVAGDTDKQHEIGRLAHKEPEVVLGTADWHDPRGY